MPNNPFKSEKLDRSVGGFVFMPPATGLTDFFRDLTELLTRFEQMFLSLCIFSLSCHM